VSVSSCRSYRLRIQGKRNAYTTQLCQFTCWVAFSASEVSVCLFLGGAVDRTLQVWATGSYGPVQEKNADVGQAWHGESVRFIVEDTNLLIHVTHSENWVLLSTTFQRVLYLSVSLYRTNEANSCSSVHLKVSSVKLQGRFWWDIFLVHFRS
jgi:hypothetical protein